MLSIIIITKEEEKVLPDLLNSIRNQSYKDYEIIVSDSDSKDKTKDIAKSYNCRIVDGGKNHVTARNIGAKSSNGNMLLFFDADVVLPDNFLISCLNELEKRKLDIATPFYKPISKNLIDHLLYGIYNLYSLITFKFYPHASGFCIFCKKDLFDAVGGFDENLLVGEDFEFTIMASKKGRFGILYNKPILNNIRRIKKWGRWGILKNYTLAEFHRVTKGEMYEKAPFDYVLNGGTVVGVKHDKR